jgi:hypothetical protein
MQSARHGQPQPQPWSQPRAPRLLPQSVRPGPPRRQAGHPQRAAPPLGQAGTDHGPAGALARRPDPPVHPKGHHVPVRTHTAALARQAMILGVPVVAFHSTCGAAYHGSQRLTLLPTLRSAIADNDYTTAKLVRIARR